jgi:hypothetical protein
VTSLFNVVLGLALIILGAVSILCWMFLFVFLLINKGVAYVTRWK